MMDNKYFFWNIFKIFEVFVFVKGFVCIVKRVVLLNGLGKNLFFSLVKKLNDFF